MDIATTLQRNLKQLDRMRNRAIKGLLKTLKNIDAERRKRTADLEVAAKAIYKELAQWGHRDGVARKPRRKTTVTKRQKSGRRVRRTSDQLQAEAKAIVGFIAAGKEKGRSGAEIRAKFKSVGEGMTIKTFVQKYTGEKIRTKGQRSKMRYFA